MATKKSSTEEVKRSDARADDPFAKAVIYRLRRDALLIVSNLNRGRSVGNEAMKRQLVFIQGRLCEAAMADPRLPEAVKGDIVKFQATTIAQNLQDRRGTKRRAPLLEILEAMA